MYIAAVKAQPSSMRRVQRDGFVIFTLGDDPEPTTPPQPGKAAAPRARPVSASRSRIAEHGGAVLAGHAAIARERNALWKVAAPPMILIIALSGLFGAYSLGRQAAASGVHSGFAYPKPALAGPLR